MTRISRNTNSDLAFQPVSSGGSSLDFSFCTLVMFAFMAFVETYF